MKIIIVNIILQYSNKLIEGNKFYSVKSHSRLKTFKGYMLEGMHFKALWLG